MVPSYGWKSDGKVMVQLFKNKVFILWQAKVAKSKSFTREINNGRQNRVPRISFIFVQCSKWQGLHPRSKYKFLPVYLGHHLYVRTQLFECILTHILSLIAQDMQPTDDQHNQLDYK